jgi:hypothetical protein
MRDFCGCWLGTRSEEAEKEQKDEEEEICGVGSEEAALSQTA